VKANSQASAGADLTDVREEDSDFAAFDDAVAGDARDPYPELAAVRQSTPVQKLDMSAMPHEGDSPVFFIYRFEDVFRVLRDPETFSSGQIMDLLMGDVMGKHIMLGMDEPRHGRYRNLVATAFRQKQIATWENELVRKTADELIDKFADRGHAELVREFTFPYPTKIIAALLGLPGEDYRQFQRWSLQILSFFADRPKAIQASQEIEEYLKPILADRRVNRRDDIISDLVHADLDGDTLSDDEIYSFVRLLMPAGVETTYRSIGNILYSLLTRPDQLDRVRNDRLLVPTAIEEGLRYETPLLNITRVATRDTEIGGIAIPAGSTLLLMLSSANHDELRYRDSEDYIVQRTDDKPHISFGAGPHVCLGMHLARMEMRVAINAIFDRLPNLRLDPDTSDDPHIRGGVFRSPTSLPVLFDN
jgi:cytochrome P450